MTKLILDLDTGIDDTLALMYALGSPEAQLLGITGTFGNVTVAQGVTNDLALLALFGREDVPVYAGIDHPSTAERYTPAPGSLRFHGTNGLGGAQVPAVPTQTVQAMSAVDVIIDAVETYGPDELTIVPTGALTTIDAVLARRPDLASRMRLVLMGGALTVPGNVSPFAEANIHKDPEAADRVFKSGADLTMIGLDVTMRARLPRADAERLFPADTAGGTFLAEMLGFYLDATAKTAPAGEAGCCLHDPLAVAVALDPTLVTTLELDLRVDCAEPGRGRTIGDPERLLAPSGRTHVALDVDADRFYERFCKRVSMVARSRC